MAKSDAKLAPRPGEDPDERAKRVLHARLQPFVGLTDQRPKTVQPGSLLRRLNDAVGHPFQVSHQIVGVQIKAVDHFVASFNLAFVAQVMHPWASLTLARGALEAAATAAWLACAPSDEEKLTRALWWQGQDLADELTFLREWAPPDANPERLEDRKRRLRETAVRVGVNPDRVVSPLGLSRIMRTVGEEHKGKLLGGVSPMLQWRMLSGAAHGRQWASLQGLQKEIVEDHGDGTVILRQSTNATVLAYTVDTAIRLFDASMKAYEHDRLVWRESTVRP